MLHKYCDNVLLIHDHNTKQVYNAVTGKKTVGMYTVSDFMVLWFIKIHPPANFIH